MCQAAFPLSLQRGSSFHLQLIDVGVKYAVDEADAGRLVGVLIRELDVDLPKAALEGCCHRLLVLSRLPILVPRIRTFRRPFEPDVELLPSREVRL